MRQLILDTETTGFKPQEGHRIIEFAAMEVIDRELTGNFLHLYFNPERDIPEEATQVHGITLDQVKDKPTFKESVKEIIEYIEDSELIIHNAKFDLSFLDHHFKALAKKNTLNYAKSVVDTLSIARSKFPGAKNSLDALCDRFRVDRANRGYHGALIDCELLFKVYLCLTREQISLLADEKKLNQSLQFGLIDKTKYNLKLAPPNPDELINHQNYLAKMDEENSGKTLWLLDNDA